MWNLHADNAGTASIASGSLPSSSMSFNSHASSDLDDEPDEGETTPGGNLRRHPSRLLRARHAAKVKRQTSVREMMRESGASDPGGPDGQGGGSRDGRLSATGGPNAEAPASPRVQGPGPRVQGPASQGPPSPEQAAADRATEVYAPQYTGLERLSRDHMKSEWAQEETAQEEPGNA